MSPRVILGWYVKYSKHNIVIAMSVLNQAHLVCNQRISSDIPKIIFEELELTPCIFHIKFIQMVPSFVWFLFIMYCYFRLKKKQKM